MTYLHIHDQGLPKHALGERRSDCATADDVDDALRAQGLRAAAQAMEHQHVDLAVALRVLSHSGRRRSHAQASAINHPHAPQPHRAGVPDFAAVPA